MMCERCGGPHDIFVCPLPYDDRPKWCERCHNQGEDLPCVVCGRRWGPETRRRMELAAKYDAPFDPNDPSLPAKVERLEAAIAWRNKVDSSEQAYELAETGPHDDSEVIDPMDVVIDGIRLGVLMWADEAVRAGVSVRRSGSSVFAVRSREDWIGNPDGGGGWLSRDEILNGGDPFDFTPDQRRAVDTHRRLDEASTKSTQETTC